MSSDLEHLGRLVARRQDEDLARAGSVGEVVRGTLGSARLSRRLSARRAQARWRLALFPLAAALAALIYWLAAGRAAPSGAPSTSALAAEGEQPFVFDDGTTMLIARGGAARVIQVGSDGGHVALTRGTASISVPPDRGRKWSFDCGPYRVDVTGTRFDLSWSPDDRRFDLQMHDGSVVVSGAGLAPRIVSAGERLTLAPEAPPDAEVSRGSSAAPESAGAATTSPPRAATSAIAAPAASGRPAAPPERASWQALALVGQYREAVQVAQAGGFDAALAKSSSSELLLLGDACRFAGETALGASAYDAVRERYPGTPEAHRALFSRGVLAFPSSAAVAFFEQYLSEVPSGPLAPEALGRILELRHRNGEHEAAASLARRYLAAHPNGAHAKLARSILGDAKP